MKKKKYKKISKKAKMNSITLFQINNLNLIHRNLLEEILMI